MKNHNTQECLPVPGSIAKEDTAVSGDTSDLFCAKSSSDICEANITCSQEQRGSVKAAPTQNCVFVVDTNRTPLTPCTPARARQLLKSGKAAILRKFPFTIILKKMVDEEPTQVEAKIDPGAKTTGIALIHKKQNRVLFAMNLVHRGQEIKGSLLSRRQLRRSRRSRKTRYRKARFDHRRKATGWLPPSLEHRLQTTMTWVTRFTRFSPLDSLAVERVKFDVQKMENPEISGIEYQQGTLQGYEVREYLLEKWGRKCAYCEAENVPLEVEHIKPKSKGGSNRVSNLTLSCRPCNKAKGTKSVTEFLSKKPEILKKILSQAKRSLASTAAVNATRNALLNRLRNLSLGVATGTGAQTKFNRIKNDYPKDHWIDAACVGNTGAEVLLNPEMRVLEVKSTGHGTRQFCGTNKYGFPVRHRSAKKNHFGFETGDIVIAVVPSGKKAGRHKGRVLCRATGSFDISKRSGRVQGISHRYCRVSQRKDGYNYQFLN